MARAPCIMKYNELVLVSPELLASGGTLACHPFVVGIWGLWYLYMFPYYMGTGWAW